jgi:hypothetical protein
MAASFKPKFRVVANLVQSLTTTVKVEMMRRVIAVANAIGPLLVAVIS